jgi:hypothetical protein
MNIKPELKEKYEHYVKINCEDEYSKAVIKAGEAVMTALDDGKTVEDAHNAIYGKDLTGYMAGAAIQAVCHFHPRGEEMRLWWNKRWGVKEDKGGVVNPAILEINGK